MDNNEIVADIVTAVAAADGVDPTDVAALYDHIDPAVLRKLCAQDRGQWRLRFQFSDHQVTVTHDSEILVDGIPNTADVSSNEFME